MEAESLLREITEYCRNTGVAESTFGRLVVNAAPVSDGHQPADPSIATPMSAADGTWSSTTSGIVFSRGSCHQR